MTAPHPSEQTRQLMHAMAVALVQDQDAWLDELTAESLSAAGMETTAADPVLRASAQRAFRASFLHWATQNVQHPGASVGPAVGNEVVHIARDLIRRGLEDTATAAYRAGQSHAVRHCVNRAFDYTVDPVQLRELLDTLTWSISDFVESTLAQVTEMMRNERAEILRGSRPELRETVALLLDGAPISRQRAESRLAYRLGPAHTAVVVWSAEPDTDVRSIDDVVEQLTRPWPIRPLIIRPGASTKWVWLPGSDDIDREQLRSTVDPTGSVRVAVGGRAEGIDGFRRSHADATAAQRMVARLDSAQRVVFFDDVQLVALMTTDAEGAERFVRHILGDLAHSPRELRETTLAFIEEQGGVSRVAARQYTHRNTVVRRLARAESLLPRPLAANPVQVAAALQILRWTGHGRSDPQGADHL